MKTRGFGHPRLAVLAAVALLAVGCSSSPSGDSFTSPSGSTVQTAAGATEHEQNLCEGETAALTAELVSVPGHEYTDVSSDERTAELCVSAGGLWARLR
jgi:hypothetical protein